MNPLMVKRELAKERERELTQDQLQPPQEPHKIELQKAINLRHKKIKGLLQEIATLEGKIQTREANKGDARPEDIERFNKERKQYHHIDCSTNRFRVQVQVNGKRLQKRFVSLDEAVAYRDKLINPLHE